MKKVAPKIEGSELFINGRVEETNPDGFLEEWDSVWVEVSNEDLLDIALENKLVKEEELLNVDAQDEILDSLMSELDPLYENLLKDRLVEKLEEGYADDIKECGGLEVIFDSKDIRIIK